MNGEKKKMEVTCDTRHCEIVESEKNELSILATDEDKYGTDITKMSNFFEIYIQQLSCELSTNTLVDVLRNIPVADIGIINDVVRHAEVMMVGKYGYVPDFDSLPHDIKTKFQKGIYKIGESKQVDGNMRAVILDENDIRVKDITLKRVKNNPDTVETTRSIANQMQMRQIYAKLDDIQELQSYQIDRDRDRDIVTPFLNARSYILRAQYSELLEERKDCLKKATDELTTAMNAVYSDLSTSSEHLVKLTRWPIFQKPNQIKNYMGYLTLDLQLATKFVGVQMHVFDYLGDKTASKLALEGYQHVMQDFYTKSINKKNQSAARLIHQHYPYNENNRNCWMELAANMKPMLQAGTKSIEGKEILLVSIEDIENEEENI
ncbi:MAG: hypothetical protein CVU92_02715 [Firmicutes bacterium HGW-Firmicutes-17]|jgi:hypothetical protein|nr:MAG: hypothetical protein CVU92_02715 [Firmicutes bacterium HGW-Firmicutes-17]